MINGAQQRHLNESIIFNVAHLGSTGDEFPTTLPWPILPQLRAILQYLDHKSLPNLARCDGLFRATPRTVAERQMIGPGISSTLEPGLATSPP